MDFPDIFQHAYAHIVDPNQAYVAAAGDVLAIWNVTIT
jgi:hypothetical protein